LPRRRGDWTGAPAASWQRATGTCQAWKPSEKIPAEAPQI